jgi:hypothetical protein
MKFPAKTVWLWQASAMCAAFFVACATPSVLAQTAQIQHVKVLPSNGAVEIEIQMSQAVAPRAQVVPSPDRLVLDFPQSTPGPQLRALSVNRGDVVGVRAGLFASNPPTTRIVLDLKAPSAYQIFPSGKSVLVKLGGPVPAAEAAATEAPAPPEPPKPQVTVGFQNGLLSINAEKATLAQVLYEIHTQTGAEVAVPAGAEQEQVVTSLGPAPPKDVLAALLNGSPYNFILVGSSSDPNVLERILLSQKGTSMVVDVATPQQGADTASANGGVPAYATNSRMMNARGRSAQPTPDADAEINNLPADEEPQPGDTQQPAEQQEPAAAPQQK